jgi:hypothetical protein
MRECLSAIGYRLSVVGFVACVVYLSARLSWQLVAANEFPDSR